MSSDLAWSVHCKGGTAATPEGCPAAAPSLETDPGERHLHDGVSPFPSWVPSCVQIPPASVQR
jgi:hypothetical protein